MARLVMVSNRVIDFNVAQQAGGVSVAIYNTLSPSKRLLVRLERTNRRQRFARDQIHDGRRPHDGNGASDRSRLQRLLSRLFQLGSLAGFSQSARSRSIRSRLLLPLCRGEPEIRPKLAPLIQPDDVIWIHDYHLLPMALELRRLGIRKSDRVLPAHSGRPRPSASRYPWNKAIARALSAYDLIGLQTQSDVRNLIDFLQQSVFGRLLPSGRIRIFETEVDIGCFPVGIDPADFAFGPGGQQAPPAPTTAESQSHNRHRPIGLHQGAAAEISLLWKIPREFPEYRRRIVLSQFAPPTRESVEAYADIKAELESLAGSINGRSRRTRLGSHQLHSPDHPQERAAGRLPPIADRMGHAADGRHESGREGIHRFAEPGRPGCLILSKFAGAAAQLSEALLVNPYDLNDLVQGLRVAIEMPLDERRARYEKLVSIVHESDSDAWSRSYFSALIKAGQRRLGRSSKSSAEMGRTLERLQVAVKKTPLVASLRAKVGI